MDLPLPPLSEAFHARYRIERLLGQGGMGSVYLARDQELGRDVAIKFLAEFGATQDSDAGRRFAEEARVCAQLKHAAIVGLFSLGWEGETPYLVFEYVVGPTLAAEITAHGRLPVDRALKVGVDILRALAVAHEAGIVHRDVKPANILLRAPDDRAMLGDFGLAKSTRRGFHTEAGLVMGTPLYMAPEVIRGGAATSATDIYALGCVLYESLTGSPPLMGKTDIVTLQMHLEKAPRRLSEVMPGVPAELDAAVLGALAKDPAARPPTASGLADALSAVLARMSPDALHMMSTVTPLPPVSRPSQPGRSRGSSTRLIDGARSVSKAPVTVAMSRSGRRPGRARRLLALVAAGAVGLSLGVAWWLTRERASGVRVVLEGDAATIGWVTTGEHVGRVKILSGGRSDEVQEAKAGAMHNLTARGLRPGVPVDIVVLGTGERELWRTGFTPPTTAVVSIEAGSSGEGCRVRARRPAARTVLRLGAAAAPIVAKPDPEAAVFEVPMAADCLPPGVTLEETLAPDVVAVHPVPTAGELASRLADALDGFQVAPLVARLVAQRDFDPWKDFPKRLANYDVLRATGAQVTVRPPDYYRHALAAARALPFWGALEAFRPAAAGYFRCAEVSDAAKLRLYGGLAKLRPLDLLSASQHDPQNLRTAELYASFVTPTHVLPAPKADLAAGALELLPPLTCWHPTDFYDWAGMAHWAKINPTFSLLNPTLDPGDARTVRGVYASSRSRQVTLPAARRDGVATLRAQVHTLGPSYLFEVTFTSPESSNPLSFVLCQDGTATWFEGMDELPLNFDHGPPKPSGRPAMPEVLTWGEISLRFPARLLPAGPVKVRVEYRHLPGPRIDKLSNIQRLAYIRTLSLEL